MEQRAFAISVEDALQKVYPNCSLFDTAVAPDSTRVLTFALHQDLMGQVTIGKSAQSWARQILAHCALYNCPHISRIYALQKIPRASVLPVIVLSIVRDCERFAATADDAAARTLDDKGVWRTFAAAASAVQEAHFARWTLGPFRASDMASFCNTAAFVNLHRSSPLGVAVDDPLTVEDLIRMPPNTRTRDGYSDLWALGCLLVEFAVGMNRLPLHSLVRSKILRIFGNGLLHVRAGLEMISNPLQNPNEPLSPEAVNAHHRMFLASEGKSLLSFWGFNSEPFATRAAYKRLEMCIDLCMRARQYAEVAFGSSGKDIESAHEASGRILQLVVSLIKEEARPVQQPVRVAHDQWEPLQHHPSPGNAGAMPSNAEAFAQKLAGTGQNQVAERALYDMAWPFSKPQAPVNADFMARVRAHMATDGFAESVVKAMTSSNVLRMPQPPANFDGYDPALESLRSVLERNFAK